MKILCLLGRHNFQIVHDHPDSKQGYCIQECTRCGKAVVSDPDLGCSFTILNTQDAKERDSAMEKAALRDDTLALSLPFGCHIRTAAAKAIKRAHETGLSVHFVFNDVPLVVTAKNDPDTVERVYLSHQSALSIHGADAFDAMVNEKLDENVKRAQSMLAALPNSISDENALVAWIGAFALLNLATGFDRCALADKLEAAGYVADDMTSDPIAAPTKRQQARYIIGQAISALRNGQAIHPVLCAHAERYKKAN